MASTVRSIAGVLLRRSPAMETARRTVCRLSEVAVFKASPVPDLPSQKTSMMVPLEDDFDMFDPDAHYPDPAESLSILAPLDLSLFSGDLCSTKLLSEAPRYAALRALKADAEAGTVLDYIPCLSETAIDKTNVAASEISESLPPSPAEPLRKLSPLRPVMSGTVSVLPSLTYGTRSNIKLKSRGIFMVSCLGCSHGFKSLPIFGQRMLSTGQEAKGDSVKFEDFEKLYQRDRVYLGAGIKCIAAQLNLVKDEVELIKVKVVKSDVVKKWWSGIAKETFDLTESHIERIENAYTVCSYAFGFLAWGSLVLFGLITVKENDVPVRDYWQLLNAVRVQALKRGIDYYKEEKQIRSEKAKAKAAKAAAEKKAANEAAEEKKAKEAEAVALRKANGQQALRKSRVDQADSARKAKAKEAHAVRLAIWNQKNAARKESTAALNAKIEQAALQIKLKAGQAIVGSMSKANVQAAAAAAARKSFSKTGGGGGSGGGGQGGGVLTDKEGLLSVLFSCVSC